MTLTGILKALELLSEVAEMLWKLHKAGVDSEVVDDIHRLSLDFHSAIDTHHTKAGLKDK